MTLADEYKQIKRQYPDAILLFRVGDFYEAFGNDAKTIAKVLGLCITRGRDGLRLAGFARWSLDSYVAKLVKEGHRVAICEPVSPISLDRSIKVVQL